MKSKNKDKKEKVKREKGGIIHDEGKKRHTLNNERETEQNRTEQNRTNFWTFTNALTTNLTIIDNYTFFILKKFLTV